MIDGESLSFTKCDVMPCGATTFEPSDKTVTFLVRKGDDSCFLGYEWSAYV
jgi:hypothetical protein